MSDQFPAHQSFVDFAHTLADASGAMLRASAAQVLKIETKPDASFVTETDKEIELKLREMIAAAFPDHGILGEEFEPVNPDADLVWVLDPIDGTAPFIAGIPVYGTLIGLAWQGKPFVGVIDHPATSDRWCGVSGMFATRNGQPVTTRNCAGLAQAFTTCSSPDFMTEAELESFSRLRALVPYVQYGGSCFVHGLLASGRTDIAIDSGLESYDVFASSAVIQGAGGLMTDWQGNEITLDWAGQVIASGSQACLDQAIRVLAGK